MIVFGGGHSTYFGSDVHAFDLASREWSRLTSGFVTGKREDYGEGAFYSASVYPDGSPLPPHTYDYVQYDDEHNNYMLLKGQTELGPHVKAVAIPHSFNLDTLTWRHGPKHPSAILNSGGFTTWDPKRRLLWGHSGDDGGGNAFVGYSPDGENADGTIGAWREFHPNKLKGVANHNAMRYHPDFDLIVVSIHARDQLAAIDPKNPANPVTVIASEGAKPRMKEYAALEYAPGLRSLVYYSAADGPSVYRIECAATARARWHSLTSPTTLDPIADAAAQTRHAISRAHTFGRFRIASFGDLDLAILVRHIDSSVYGMVLPPSPFG